MPASLPTTSLLDCLGHRLYAKDCRERAEVPVRWLCLNDETRLGYLKLAEEFYLAWCRGEIAAEVRRSGL